MTPELNVLALYKGKQKFIFVYDDHSLEALIQEVRNLAASPNDAFTWFDASVLTEKAREQVLLANEEIMPVQRIL